MNMRGMVVRLVELRARRFADPVQRLQFLRQSITPGHSVEARHKRTLAAIIMLTISTAVAFAAALTYADWRRALAFIALPAPAVRKVHAASRLPKAIAAAVPRVWPVETNAKFDLYSNGLRVENEFTTSTQTRTYLALVRARNEAVGERRHEPAGIVFHTTESHMAPFEEDQNQTLKRAGESLLEYVRRRQCYHFVIDRFGRVFRIVRETDYANHAGHSIWADQTWIYVNLNQSFFGVAFEARSSRDSEGVPVNPAQVHAGRILTEMLLARYAIAPANCVTHAQVSVNPKNMRAGYHADWAANLPFRELGLSDNYERPLPSVTLFGFGADDLLAQAGDSPLAQALQSAEDEIQEQAAARGVTAPRYRETLQQRYREAIAALRAKDVSGENN